MGKQMTEMLKGTLEGIVLAILSGRPAYGYEITAWLREQGFSDIAEGTVYALLVRSEQRGLVDVQKVPIREGAAARSTRSTLRDRHSSKSSGRRGASSRNASRSSTADTPTQERSDHGQLDRGDHGIARAEEAVPALQGPHRGPPRALRRRREGPAAVLHVLRGRHRRRDRPPDVRRLRRPLGTGPPPTVRPCARSSARTRSSSPRRSPRPTRAGSGSTRNALA